MKSPVTRWVTHLLGLLAAVATFLVPPAKSFQEPNLARIVVVHLPCALMTVWWLGASAWLAFRSLRTRSPEFGEKHAVAWELSTIFSLYAITTGILFSRVQWGAWWQRDPRQESFLFVVLILVAGILIRNGLADPVRRQVASAAYTLISFPTLIFLILVYPRLPSIQRTSFHPSTTIAQGGFELSYKLALYAVFGTLLVVATVIYRARARALGLQRELELAHANLDAHRRDLTGRAVVRPVSVSDPN